MWLRPGVRHAGSSSEADYRGLRGARGGSSDLDAANQICQRVHGHDRSGELRDGIAQGTARVVDRPGRITGYASASGYFGHAVGESNLDLEALIAAADDFGMPGIIVLTRNADLFCWCLESGLRVLHPMTLMILQ
jgi:hypothetical protein